LKINSYAVYCKDRSDNSGYGGVAIYVVDHLLLQRRPEIEVQSLQYICVEIKNNGKSILVGVCYRPPCSLLNVRTTFIENFENVIENMKSHGSDFMMFSDDFNDR
jgi:exonuclease III